MPDENEEVTLLRTRTVPGSCSLFCCVYGAFEVEAGAVATVESVKDSGKKTLVDLRVHDTVVQDVDLDDVLMVISFFGISLWGLESGLARSAECVARSARQALFPVIGAII